MVYKIKDIIKILKQYNQNTTICIDGNFNIDDIDLDYDSEFNIVLNICKGIEEGKIKNEY
jgi:hypothetical protein|tara:strand:+ start:808 stop:987 length:180 start_codon:yes stop_codon:yes gene_type:complete